MQPTLGTAQTRKPVVINVSAAYLRVSIIYQLRMNQRYASQSSNHTLIDCQAIQKMDNPQKLDSLPAKLKNIGSSVKNRPDYGTI